MERRDGGEIKEKTGKKASGEGERKGMGAGTRGRGVRQARRRVAAKKWKRKERNNKRMDETF